jgi:lipopolysaccharide/colanic/teichoic acid biosynthesis glycosyltransferase
MGAFWSVIGEVLIGLVSAEMYESLPRLANKLLRYHAKRLPEELSDRLLEEWQATLTDLPGHLSQFIFALDLFRGRPRIIHEFYCPQVPFRPSAEMSARVLSVMFSGGMLFAVAPSLLLIALILRLSSSGPIFSRVQRMGQGARPFSFLLFATQELPSERWLPTKVRHVLNKASVDQLAVLFNILRGDMNLIGPWAFKASDIERYELNKFPNFAARYAVKPGLLGLAQLYAPKNATVRQKLRYDLLYLKKRSIWLDLQLLFVVPLRADRDRRHHPKRK